MDFIRIALIGAIAIAGYMLLIQWQKDYGQAPDYVSDRNGLNAGSAQSPELNNFPARQPPSSGLPPAPLPVERYSSASDGDLPQPQVDWETTSESAAPEHPEKSADHSQDYVEVITDVLHLRIDLQGGDISYVALPAYPRSVESPNTPFVVMNNRQSTYIAQSGIIGTSGKDLDAETRPHYRSAQSSYRLGDANEMEVVLTYEWNDGLKAEKIFHLKAGSYLVNVRHRVVNQTETAWKGYMFTQLKRDDAPDPGANQSAGFGLPTYLGTAFYRPDEKYNKLDFDDIAEKGKRALSEDIKGGWLAIVQHYFLSAWIPGAESVNRYYTDRRGLDNIIGATSPAFDVAPSGSKELTAGFYAGPKIQEQLKEVSDGLHLAVDYGILFFISNLLFLLLKAIYAVVGNWGWAIVILTLFIKILFYYPSALSYRSMANMRRVQPELIRIRERYSDDRQQLSQAMMKLYKDEKINPLGGCLPVLLQMPVFIALYWALLESVELRQAEFIGWINDLASMDEYFVLPLLMGASMFVQSLLNPAPPDPMQAKMMRLMPIVFTVFFLFFPSGLVLYWLTNNILSIMQQWFISKKVEQEALAAKK